MHYYLSIYHNSKANTEAIAKELAWQKRYNFSIGYALGRTYVHSEITGYTGRDTDIEGSFDHFQAEGAKKYDQLKKEIEEAKEALNVK